MQMDEAEAQAVVNRLRRARGQIDGVIAMIEAGRPCKDIVTQLAAASRALDKAGYKVIATSLKQCLANPEDPQSLSSEELEKLFLSLA